jgi:hypothetical protein
MGVLAQCFLMPQLLHIVGSADTLNEPGIAMSTMDKLLRSLPYPVLWGYPQSGTLVFCPYESMGMRKFSNVTHRRCFYCLRVLVQCLL